MGVLYRADDKSASSVGENNRKNKEKRTLGNRKETEGEKVMEGRWKSAENPFFHKYQLLSGTDGRSTYKRP